jgi:hypothetical protein
MGIPPTRRASPNGEATLSSEAPTIYEMLLGERAASVPLQLEIPVPK